MVQSLHHNSIVQKENLENANRKLGRQIAKFSKLKESRKKVVERKNRLEQKVKILASKLNQQTQASRLSKKKPANSQD